MSDIPPYEQIEAKHREIEEIREELIGYTREYKGKLPKAEWEEERRFYHKLIDHLLQEAKELRYHSAARQIANNYDANGAHSSEAIISKHKEEARRRREGTAVIPPVPVPEKPKYVVSKHSKHELDHHAEMRSYTAEANTKGKGEVDI